MKGLPWIIVGIGVGAAITYMLFNEPEPAYDTGYDGFADVARKTFSWGTRKQAEGKVGAFAGTGNPNLADEGAADRVAGKVKDAVGQLGQAAGQTIHDLNK